MRNFLIAVCLALAAAVLVPLHSRVHSTPVKSRQAVATPARSAQVAMAPMPMRGHAQKLMYPPALRPAAMRPMRRGSHPLKVTGVAADNSSAKVYYAAVPGARDYRVYDTANPMVVKYAGLVHLVAPPGRRFVTERDGVTVAFPYRTSIKAKGPTTYDGPADSIEWNRLEDGQQHTLVVQAVDQLGPVPPTSLYDNENSARFVFASTMTTMGRGRGMAMPSLGTNSGQTLDGHISINGQGPYTDMPRVVASSPSFVVRADVRHIPIPSMKGALQTYLDTFKDAEARTLTRTAKSDQAQTTTYRLNAGTPQAATISYQFADTMHSFPFIHEGHFMDVLFDGGTPGTNNPLHQGHASMTFTPDATVSMANGGVVHVTMEVDGHLAGRRWVAMVLAPRAAPITNPVWEIPQAISSTDQALVVQLFPDHCTLSIFTAPTSTTDPQATGSAGGTFGASLWGAAGQAADDCQDVTIPAEMGINGNINGTALDNRTRYDLFVSPAHVALFIDGKLLKQSSIPTGSFPWAREPLQVSFVHYVYHTDNDINDLRRDACYPENAYWFNDSQSGTQSSQDSCNAAYPKGYGFQRSDERHWDNMGFEALPANVLPPHGNFSALARLIEMPRIHRPKH